MMKEIIFSEDEQLRVDAFLSRLEKAIEIAADSTCCAYFYKEGIVQAVVYNKNVRLLYFLDKDFRDSENRFQALCESLMYFPDASYYFRSGGEKMLMQSVVREVIKSGDLAMMDGLLTYLPNLKDVFQVDEMINELSSAINEQLNHAEELKKSKNTTILEVEMLRVKHLLIDGEGQPHLPECLSIETSTNLYYFLSGQNPKGIHFIDGNKTPLADFNFLMGAASHYTTPGKPKPIWWLSNKQMLRELIKLAFAPLLENGTTINSLAEFVPKCLVDEEGNRLILAKEDKRRIVFQELKVLQEFFAAYSRPINNT